MALTPEEVKEIVTFSEKSNHFDYFASRKKKEISILPLYNHKFRFLRPHKLSDAEKFNVQYPDPKMLTEIPDKLRYYRYRKCMLQRDVADSIGINRITYTHYEEKGRDYYPLNEMEKLAKLFEVDITELLDDYNTFLLNGQGEQMLKFRKSKNLTQREFAERFGVTRKMVNDWENEKCRLSKRS